MKLSISRGTVLSLGVAAILLATLPSSILRLFHSRDPYLFTRQFFLDILARLSGPGRFRFILQPTVAISLGLRDGLKEARAGAAPFLWAFAFHGTQRADLLRSALASVRELVCVAILLDLISQYLIFREVRPGAALVVGPVLITLPYAISRALTNRIWQARIRGKQLE